MVSLPLIEVIRGNITSQHTVGDAPIVLCTDLSEVSQPCRDLLHNVKVPLCADHRQHRSSLNNPYILPCTRSNILHAIDQERRSRGLRYADIMAPCTEADRAYLRRLLTLNEFSSSEMYIIRQLPLWPVKREMQPDQLVAATADVHILPADLPLFGAIPANCNLFSRAFSLPPDSVTSSLGFRPLPLNYYVHRILVPKLSISSTWSQAEMNEYQRSLMALLSRAAHSDHSRRDVTASVRALIANHLPFKCMDGSLATIGTLFAPWVPLFATVYADHPERLLHGCYQGNATTIEEMGGACRIEQQSLVLCASDLAHQMRNGVDAQHIAKAQALLTALSYEREGTLEQMAGIAFIPAGRDQTSAIALRPSLVFLAEHFDVVSKIGRTILPTLTIPHVARALFRNLEAKDVVENLRLLVASFDTDYRRHADRLNKMDEILQKHYAMLMTLDCTTFITPTDALFLNVSGADLVTLPAGSSPFVAPLYLCFDLEEHAPPVQCVDEFLLPYKDLLTRLGAHRLRPVKRAKIQVKDAAPVVQLAQFMLKTESFDNVQFVVGDTTFKANAAVLANVSPFFLAMFTSSFQEASGSQPVNIGDMDPGVFATVLHYAYTGLLRLSTSDSWRTLEAKDNAKEVDEDKMVVELLDVLEAARRWQMDHLFALCEQALILRVHDVRHFANIRTWAVRLDAQQLLHYCDAQMTANKGLFDIWTSNGM